MIRERDLPPETLRVILERSQPAERAPIGRKKPLVQPGISIEPERLTILVAVETVNETNARQWKARSRRSGAAWKAVREAIGPQLGALEPFARHYASGGALSVVFVRLGSRRLDVMANLGSSLKGVEDATAYLLGANDGSPQWRAVAQQEPEALYRGVRIELKIFGD